MCFIVEKKVSIINENVLADAPVNLMNDVLSSIARRDKEGDPALLLDYNFMSVSELRRRADRYWKEIRD
jgi:hypothetical protein